MSRIVKLKCVLFIMMYGLASNTWGMNRDEDIYISTSLILISPIISVGYTTYDVFQDLKGLDFKVVMQARDDAAVYIGSAGEHRGVYLEAALSELKAYGLQQDDMQLAAWILGVSTQSSQ